jgi:hypothetical protein
MTTSYKSTLSKTLVTLPTGQTYTVQNTDTSVSASAGSSSTTVVLPDTAKNVSLSGAIASLDLSQSVFNYYFVPNGLAGIYLFSSSGAILANIASSTSGMAVVFGDQSALTLSVNSLGLEKIHYDKLQLTPNYVLSVPNSNIMLMGSSGKEVVKVPLGITQVTVDANVETVTLNSLNYSPSLLTSNGKVLSVKDAQGNTVLNWTANASGSETLNFNNAIGSLGLSPQGTAQFNISSLLLNAGQSYTLAQSGVSIYGNVGTESVTLASGVHNESIDANVEKVSLPSPVSAYTWSTQSGNISLFDATHALVATIGVDPVASSGTTLSFADQTLTAQLYNNVITFHNALGQVVQSGGTVLASSTSSPTPLATPTPKAPSSPSSASSPIAANGSATASNTASSSFSSTTSSSSSGSLSHFLYTLDWTAFSSYAGSVETSIQACLTKALNAIGLFLNAKGSLDIQVIPENTSTSVLAEASGALVTVPSSLSASSHGANETTAFLVESQTGTDANGSTPDAKVYINMANLSKFNLNTAQAPSSGQYDLTTILTHEMLHALGFDGLIGQSTSQMTTYDSYVVTKNGTPYFTGPAAESVYGGPVPLAAASAGPGSAYYHVAISSDLMSDSLSAAQVKTVSKLDVAILQDLGAPVLVGVLA